MQQFFIVQAIWFCSATVTRCISAHQKPGCVQQDTTTSAMFQLSISWLWNGACPCTTEQFVSCAQLYKRSWQALPKPNWPYFSTMAKRHMQYAACLKSWDTNSHQRLSKPTTRQLLASRPIMSNNAGPRPWTCVSTRLKTELAKSNFAFIGNQVSTTRWIISQNTIQFCTIKTFSLHTSTMRKQHPKITLNAWPILIPRKIPRRVEMVGVCS